MSKLLIDEVIEKGEAYPVIVNFQNGYTTDNFETVESFLLQEKETGKKLIAAEIDNIIYSGEEKAEDLGNKFLLARNRITGKVRLIEVGTAELRPVLQRDDISQALDTSSLELSRKFGSKKNKQKMEHSAKLKVNVDIVTKQMKNVTKSVTKDKLDLTYLVQNPDEFYIPPIDREATKVEDVYDKSKLLSDEQYEKINSEIESKDFASEYHPIIKAIVGQQKLSERDTVLALYASCLFKMYMLSGRDIVKKNFFISSSSPTLNEIVIQNFTRTMNNKRMRPTMYRDKALCHGIVLALLINNYKLEVEAISSALSITPTLVSNKVKVTSASIVTSGKKKVVHLKLPLPSIKVFRRKSSKF